MYDTVYIFFKGNQTKQNLRPFVGSQTCQVIQLWPLSPSKAILE